MKVDSVHEQLSLMLTNYSNSACPVTLKRIVTFLRLVLLEIPVIKYI